MRNSAKVRSRKQVSAAKAHLMPCKTAVCSHFAVWLTYVQEELYVKANDREPAQKLINVTLSNVYQERYVIWTTVKVNSTYTFKITERTLVCSSTVA